MGYIVDKNLLFAAKGLKIFFPKTKKTSLENQGGNFYIRIKRNYLFSNLAYFLRKRSILPAVSTKRCLPV